MVHFFLKAAIYESSSGSIWWQRDQSRNALVADAGIRAIFEILQECRIEKPIDIITNQYNGSWYLLGLVLNILYVFKEYIKRTK